MGAFEGSGGIGEAERSADVEHGRALPQRDAGSMFRDLTIDRTIRRSRERLTVVEHPRVALLTAVPGLLDSPGHSDA